MLSPLIDVAELEERLTASRRSATPNPTVLDVRYRTGAPHGAQQYAAGHVPGAVYVDLDTDLAGPAGEGGRHPLPDAEAFVAAMRKVGVGAGPVVLYDDWSGRAAARCWWLLRHHGHRDVRVLDGGWSAWCAAGGEVEVTATAERPGTVGDFVASAGPTRVVAAEEAARVAVLVDARAPERYAGEVETLDAVAGHVPGARNVPTEANLGPDGRFRAAADLRTTYAAVGARAGADVAVYCGSGVTACHDLLALEVAGVPAALYAGSWSEWVRDPDRPVATGR